MSSEFQVTIKVRSYELDSFGHVNNAVYFNYLEFARCEYMQQRGLSFDDFHQWNIFPYVLKSEIEYKSPAQVDNLLVICGKITEWRKVGFTLEYEVQNKTTGRLCATAKMSFVFVDADKKPTRIPAPFREKMRD